MKKNVLVGTKMTKHFVKQVSGICFTSLFITDIVLLTFCASEVQEHCFCLLGGLIFKAT